MRLLLTAFLLFGCLGYAGEAFKRLPFDAVLELGEEAPGVAASSTALAYADKAAVHVYDAKTFQETVLKLPDNIATGDNAIQVLGVLENKVIGSVFAFHDPDRPKAGGKVARVGGGPEPGQLEIFSLSLQGEYKKLFGLSQNSFIADSLLDGCVVCTEGRKLTLKSVVPGTADKVFNLNDQAQRRPAVIGKEVFGRGKNSVFWCASTEKELHRIPYANTPLISLAGSEEQVLKSGDLVLVAGEGITACELSGKLRWKRPLAGQVAPGDSDAICVVGYNDISGLDRQDGHTLWRRYLSPDQFAVNYNRCYGSAIVSGRLIVPTEKYVQVIDAKTGELLVSFPSNRPLKRDSYNIIFTELIKFAGAPNVALIGFETSVYAIDLTPVAQVPKAQQEQDMANRINLLQQLEKDPRAISRDSLKSLGLFLSSTPDLAPRALPLLKDSLTDLNVLMAWQWCKEKPIVTALVTEVNKADKNDYQAFELLSMLAFSADTKSATEALEKVLADPGTPPNLKEHTSQLLRAINPPVKISEADRKLAYGTDLKASVAEFNLRLKDPAQWQGTLELLKRAPDAVILEVCENNEIPMETPHRTILQDLAKQAKTRLALIDRVK